MELIHADKYKNELRYIDSFTRFDASVNLNGEVNDNSWSLTLPVECFRSNPFELGEFVYVEGGEWGGQVECIKHNSDSHTVEISGLCWRGLLLRGIVQPLEGDAHLIVEADDANDLLRMLIGSQLNDIIRVSDEKYPLECSHSFRYDDLFDALHGLAEKYGFVINVDYSDGMAVISAATLINSNGLNEFSADMDGGIVAQLGCIGRCNHMLALGGGELLNRTVLEFWLLPDGSITEDKNAEGLPSPSEWRTYLYDFSAAEDETQLRSYAKRKFKEFAKSSSMDFTLDNQFIELRLGDIVSASDEVTGISENAKISGKLLTVDSGGINIRYSMEAV